ncbi:O-antigen ligase family protein [Nocardioides gilvus]|uniref:O-antigen ligase family protein n=1 Tax=Nocardioides gilvus TaxID=1735589 RepID=UPI0013A550AD|nr:O-antigen ligase family protein [Nocardioides gilvus]
MTHPLSVRGGVPTLDGSQRVASSELPAWPAVTLFALFPIWWLLGLADLIWILMAPPMVLLMVRARAIQVPRGFGLYLLFLLWALFSGVQLERAGQAIGFSYRLLLYAAAAVLFVYVFNARRRINEQMATGALTGYWLACVFGGYLALAFPGAVIKTPLSYLLPTSLTSNELVNQMVVRRMTQWNPEAWVVLDPRPTAPFLYTNNWGNVYSLLLPFVVAYLFKVRGTPRFWVLVAIIPLSLVPAFLTLNRGMFLGLGIAAAYVALRLVLMGNVRGLVAIALMGILGAGAFFLLPAQDRLENRLSESSSTEDRTSLYTQAIDTIPESPVLGHAVPQEPDNPNLDPVGTQGQFWMVLVSHGVGALACFVGWFLLAFLMSLRRGDVTGVVANTVLLVGTIELVYYGSLPYGLPILMVAAALALRGPDAVPTGGARRRVAPGG